MPTQTAVPRPASAAEGEDPAWLTYRAQFSDGYDEANYSSPLQRWVMQASHALTEKPFTQAARFGRVLEIGAGTGEHLGFVRHGFDEYTLSDLDPLTLDIAREKLGAIHPGKLKFEVQAGGGLGYPDGQFDRLIATHVLEHIPAPHLALKEWARVLKPGGTLSVLIPTDPGMAWRLGRNLGPRRGALRRGIAYDYVMAREHVNACHNLIAFLRHYFPQGRESWWPLRAPSIDLNLFFCFHARMGGG